ncbi:MAG: outer membrane lipoprotein LolB [Methylococcales bacterium]|nr:outer membrane lipoprotein LolB [Methylococcales bacterium]MCK5926109.1 outer membrane lipoprotein LolB [Methylococcales bacterium]
MLFFKALFFLLVIALSQGCTTKVIKPVEDKYSISPENALYQLKQWSFKGRLAIQDNKESWSASIEWSHTEKEDILKLSGPLGQTGGILIVSKEAVILDRGDGKTLHSTDINGFIKQQLGMQIPVQSLRYWVLGLTDPAHKFTALADGFKQNDWIIQYFQMQQSNEQWVPQKLKAFQNKTRLKLIIDEWILK